MKNSFKNAIFGLFFALCCVFVLNTVCFKSVYVNAIEAENQETQEEVKEPENPDKTYSFVSEGEGAGTVTLHEDGSFKAIVFFISTQETLEGEGTYTIEGDLLTLTITDVQFVFIINEETMTLEEYKVIEPPSEGEQTEQEPETEEGVSEETKGFFEKNLETIIASAIGVMGSIAAFFLMVFKAGKSVKETLNAFKGKEVSAEEAMKKINEQVDNLKEAKDKVFGELNLAKEEILKITSQIDKQFAEIKDFSNEILNKYSEEINKMSEDFKKVSESLILMVNNNEDLVKKGIAKEINKKLNGGEIQDERKEEALQK